MPMLTNLGVTALERCVSALDRMAARRGRASEQAKHLETGERGELAAFFFLLRSGFTVVARRWTDESGGLGQTRGDLDLVAWQGDVLCFIEVKTRTSREIAKASSAVDRDKRKTLRRLARAYMRQLPEEERPETRFDIVTVYELPGKAREVRLIPGAFGWSERP